jgi:hypothetical protein
LHGVARRRIVESLKGAKAEAKRKRPTFDDRIKPWRPRGYNKVSIAKSTPSVAVKYGILYRTKAGYAASDRRAFLNAGGAPARYMSWSMRMMLCSMTISNISFSGAARS